MKENKQENQSIDLTSYGNPIMTPKTVQYYCCKQGMYNTAQLNDKLYLQQKGFLKIVGDTLQLYTGLEVLWLSHNLISKIQGLEGLTALASLYLDHNAIQKIENLSCLPKLTLLNLAHNKIQKVQHLQCLPNLVTLNLAENFLNDSQSISMLSSQYCPNLTSVNLSKNDLQSTQTMYKTILSMAGVNCLYLKNNPFSKGYKNYRKKLVGGLQKLKFLDDRPVSAEDHHLSEVFLKGGIEQQREQRQKMANQKLKNKQIIPLEIQFPNKTQLQIIQSKEEIVECPKAQGQNMADIQSHEIVKAPIENSLESTKPSFVNVENLGPLEDQQIQRKVKELLNVQETKPQVPKKWKQIYEPILEQLLEMYKFDFSEVQPVFNMIINGIHKKLMVLQIRFEIKELRAIWTQVEIRRRAERKAEFQEGKIMKQK